MTRWPALDRARDGATYESLHLYLQLVGKLPTRLHPWINHGWHVALQVTPAGFRTRRIPAGEQDFTVELDCMEGALRIERSGARRRSIVLHGQPVADLHGELTRALGELDLPAPLGGAPNEIENPVPFERDDRERVWDGEIVRRVHAAMASADRVFTRFRSAYTGKSSPSHLFWGAMDLAVTRFSGRRAPEHPGGFPALPDAVTREAYSHEVISSGFWLGGGGVEEAAFYTYAYPSPDALESRGVEPSAAYWHEELGEFVLPYAEVRGADDPDAMLHRFLQSTYDAAAALLDWPNGLEAERTAVGAPPAAG